MLKASLVLVHYRSPDLVVEVLSHIDSLAGERPEQIIVVDNSPEDGLADRISDDILYIDAKRNRGFAAGVNLGLEDASREIVILLNPDARPEPGCLGGLVDVLRQDPKAGIAGPSLLSASGRPSELPSATRVDPTLWTAIAEHTFARRWSAAWLDRHYFLSAARTSQPIPAAMVQGACFAFRRELIDRIGTFDERFFLYWEETDYCRRARSAGWRVYFCPQLSCSHLGGGSTPDRAWARRHFWFGLLAYQRKHAGPIRTALLRLALLIGVATEVALLGVLRLVRPADEKLRSDLGENRGRLRDLLRVHRPEALP